MNRNVNSLFAYNPTNVDISRSRFERPHDLKTSFDIGQCVPVFLDEVLPGDTFQVKTSKLVRLSTLVAPIMDNIFLDMYYFFVPHRLVWSNWVSLNGENKNSPWSDPVEYSVPQISAPSTSGWNIGTIADYFGVPTGITGFSISALPFRSYAKIINDWFRDENLVSPVVFSTGDGNTTGGNSAIDRGGLPFVAAKYHDYFTSALPSPQKGDSVTLPTASGLFPVVTDSTSVPFSKFPKNAGGSAYALNSSLLDGTAISSNTPYNAGYGTSGESVHLQAVSESLTPTSVMPRNLYAVVDNLDAISVNQLRIAFQLQKMLEKDARGGTRYIEMIKSHFGVTSPDARLQRSEYLGGNRIPLVINQVVQNSETNTTPQGNTAAYSLTVDTNNDFVHSFTEHGYIIGIAVARYKHTYQQGLNRLWSRKLRTDFYLPVLANIGEQPILNKEIYLQNDSVVDSDGKIVNDKVFGYQEAWAEYRYAPNQVTGMMRSSASGTLDFWHLADNYNTLPVLSSSWIQEEKANVDRTLAVTSSVSHQVIADFHFDCVCTRPMPLYSIPGLIDHH